MNLSTVVQIAQIATAVGSLAALSVSIYLARKSSKELRVDRRLRFHPVLAFQAGGVALDVERYKFSHRIPGLKPSFVQEKFSDISGDGMAMKVDRYYGELKNIGMGPAFDVKVVWKVEEVELENDRFAISEQKLSEPRYAEECNTLPASPRIIQPGGSSELTRVPTFLLLDFQQVFTGVDGRLIILYQDISGVELQTVQHFYLWKRVVDDSIEYGVTFGDIEELPRIDGTYS